MDYKKLLNTATAIGAALLQNGAETYRVEDSVGLVLNSYHVNEISVFAIPSHIIVSFSTKDGEPLTKSKRIKSSSLNIDRIIEINSLTRYIVANSPSIDYVNEKLSEIEGRPYYKPQMLYLANILAAVSFVVFYGGEGGDMATALFIGIALKLSLSVMSRFRLNTFTGIILNSFMIAMIALISTKLGIGVRDDAIIIGCFMLLVPGVAITNAARDFINGDVLSGTIRLFEAFLVGISIALGSGIALSIFR